MGSVTSTSGQFLFIVITTQAGKLRKSLKASKGSNLAISVHNSDETDLVIIANGAPYFGLNGQGVTRVYESELRAEFLNF